MESSVVGGFEHCFEKQLLMGGGISLTNVLNNLFDISTSLLIQINLRLIDYCLWR